MRRSSSASDPRPESWELKCLCNQRLSKGGDTAVRRGRGCACARAEGEGVRGRSAHQHVGVWRNGSASDPRSEGWGLESLCPQLVPGAPLAMGGHGACSGAQAAISAEHLRRRRRGGLACLFCACCFFRGEGGGGGSDESQACSRSPNCQSEIKRRIGNADIQSER